MKIGTCARLCGVAGLLLATSSFADDVLLNGNFGAEGIQVSLTSPVYSTEYSNPQAVPVEGWTEFESHVSDDSLSGRWELRLFEDSGSE